MRRQRHLPQSDYKRHAHHHREYYNCLFLHISPCVRIDSVAKLGFYFHSAFCMLIFYQNNVKKSQQINICWLFSYQYSNYVAVSCIILLPCSVLRIPSSVAAGGLLARVRS